MRSTRSTGQTLASSVHASTARNFHITNMHEFMRHGTASLYGVGRKVSGCGCKAQNVDLCSDLR